MADRLARQGASQELENQLQHPISISPSADELTLGLAGGHDMATWITLMGMGALQSLMNGRLLDAAESGCIRGDASAVALLADADGQLQDISSQVPLFSRAGAVLGGSAARQC